MIKLDEATIVKDYLAGVGVAELARRCEVSDWTIKNRLQKHNIKTRSWFDLKDQFDEDFFFRDSQEFYYMMGFALGDGALVFGRSQCCLTFTLKYIDRCILENFCKWTNMNQTKIKTYRNGYTVRLVFNRPWMKNFSHLGLVSRKTYHPVIPTIPHDYIAPFILGLIDADGSVSWMKPMTNNKFPHRKIQNEHTLSLVGHPLIVDWVVSQLRALEFLGNINAQIVKNKWKRMRIQRKNDVLDLARCLRLPEFIHLALPRKWMKLHQSLISMV